MRKEIIERIEIPAGVNCSYEKGILKCKKNSTEITKKILIPEVEIEVNEKEIIFKCAAGNKKHRKFILANIAHIKNMFEGLDKKFVYKLESCNVHFPISMKIEGNNFIINNFLGEKIPRKAKILKNVSVEIKGNQIIVSSSDLEAAGQTAANLERATKIKNRDRRIFQDGIFIVEKPGRSI